MKQLNEYSPVRLLSGVGPVRAAQLEKLGITTIRDLMWHFPRSYENRGDICLLKAGTDGLTHAFLLTVGSYPRTTRLKNRMTVTKFKAFDDSGTIEITFFNQPYVADSLELGATYRFWGKLVHSKIWSLTNPQFERWNETAPLSPLVPIYPLTEGFTRKNMASLIEAALRCEISDPLPEEIRLENGLPTRSVAIRSIHAPDNLEQLQLGMRRIIFDELFCLGLSLGLKKNVYREPVMAPCAPCDLTPLLSQLPYTLTDGQKQVVNEIYRDMVSSRKTAIPTMRRILIGDVGSGKTICAVIAAYIAARSGFSSAIMVPTEILANQHYHSIEPLFSKLGIPVFLLTGSLAQKKKADLKNRLADSSCEACIVIGTHALLEDNVHISNLGLTITDEQHRFGIAQRNTLQTKVQHSHLLVMSATPIPRTLALSLYGDLDVSRIEQLPAGRQAIDTFVVDESYRPRLNAFIDKQVKEGGQAYIVCPAIEAEEEAVDSDLIPLDSLSFRSRTLPPLKRVTEYAEQLSRDLPNLKIAVLHGRMSAQEKDRVMSSFSKGEIDVLVSTTVIEVGVNVPNASLMIVENAERFGLAQLHQLRGRVGRGERKSYCILVSNMKNGTAGARLKVLASTNDGYEIAEHDLALRGPGDFLSSFCQDEMRQSGGMQLRLAMCCDDTELMNLAFRAADTLLSSTDGHDNPVIQALEKEISYMFRSQN